MVGVREAWEALQFDQAVVTFGVIIENASQEQINIGDDAHPEWRSRYTMAQLLADGFTLERQDEGSVLELRNTDNVLFDEI